MNSTANLPTGEGILGRGIAPLNAAGFVTAFGAHSVAAGLGFDNQRLGFSLISFGILLAVYDIAEVILKPVFGILSDRIGIKPVIVGGLIAFSVASLAGVFATNLLLVGIARFGQGAAASAFSPAASAAVARIAGPGATGRYFGRYGSWKTLGYAAGPIIAALIIGTVGISFLFIALAACAAIAAVWAVVAVPSLTASPRQRYNIADLVGQLTDRPFVHAVAGLAIAAAALGAAVGFLPLLGTRIGSGPILSIAVVSVMAVLSAATQQIVGRVRDSRPGITLPGIVVGILLIAVGFAAVAIFPNVAVLYVAGAVLGVGIGATTTLGFAELGSGTPPERMGRTMGTAELGREIGDAGGPLLVGAVATTVTLGVGLAAFAGIAALVAATAALTRPRGLPH